MEQQTVDPRKTFGAAISALAETMSEVVVLSTDSGKSSGFGEFAASNPDRYFEVGIAEQAATGIAAGLATTGAIPVLCAIAPFVTSRNFEFFRNDVGYMAQNVKIVGRNGGFTYSELGSTHHSLEDYALVGSIPGVTVLAPSDAGEMRAACRAMLEHDGPVYMRIGAGPIPEGDERDFTIGKGYYESRGDDLTVITTGYTTVVVREAVAQLRAGGLDVELISMPTVTPLDNEIVLESARKTGVVVTVEEHYEFGGLGSRVADVLSTAGAGRLHKIAVAQENQPSSTYDDLLERNGLDRGGIIDAINRIAQKR
ncbi:transketolase family protein [Flaviflexus huanghaiensis]|uniref:transketolase family protein n=1 Tax=Flaviflexus huanghaiensis TaxID=1111473 RepID=UPI0015FA3138|nr:transketolase C-terminal domain-containing protein [Flaviflexus huanghaiensis]